MKLNFLLFIISLSLISRIHAQSESIIKALYIDHFFEADSSHIILGNPVEEELLFNYAQNCGYNYLILYGLSAVPLGSDPESVNALRSFVRRAHERYNIKLGCVGQSSKFFARIHNKYQSLDIVDSIERLDSYNLEFEFWKSYHSGIYQGYYCENYLEPNGYSCDSIGAFEFAMNELDKIDSIAGILSNPKALRYTSDVTTEIYVGWINQYQAQVLATKSEQGILDRILGAVYKSASPAGNLNLYHFFHQTERLAFLGAPQKKVNFLPIFAVKESQGNHLHDWLDTIGSIPLVWEHYSREFYQDTSSYTDSIHLQGYAWYNYSNMPICLDSLNGTAWLTGPEGQLVKDSIYSFHFTGIENADRYYWELPNHVVFADSLKWNSDVLLKFSSSFLQGDSIIVRAANRCHLGKKQYFSVKEFDNILEYHQLFNHMLYQDGKIYFSLIEDHHQVVNYQIFNLQGQLLKSGVSNSRVITYTKTQGLSIMRLEFDGNYKSFIF